MSSSSPFLAKRPSHFFDEHLSCTFTLLEVYWHQSIIALPVPLEGAGGLFRFLSEETKSDVSKHQDVVQF
jgi:hypothetical protein